MIKLNDLKPTIFVELEKLCPNNKVFQVIGTGEEIDALYLFMYGERYTTDDLDSIKSAQYIKTIYADKWDRAYDLVNAMDDILPDLGSKETKTTTHRYKYTDTINDVDNVPVFDSTETGLNSENNRTLTHDETGESGVNERIENTDKRNIYNFNASYEYLRKNWLNDIVFTDVNTILTMSIHN